jgi:hypothetical protein
VWDANGDSAEAGEESTFLRLDEIVNTALDELHADGKRVVAIHPPTVTMIPDEEGIVPGWLHWSVTIVYEVQA